MKIHIFTYEKFNENLKGCIKISLYQSQEIEFKFLVLI